MSKECLMYNQHRSIYKYMQSSVKLSKTGSWGLGERDGDSGRVRSERGNDGPTEV